MGKHRGSTTRLSASYRGKLTFATIWLERWVSLLASWWLNWTSFSRLRRSMLHCCTKMNWTGRVQLCMESTRSLWTSMLRSLGHQSGSIRIASSAVATPNSFLKPLKWHVFNTTLPKSSTWAKSFPGLNCLLKSKTSCAKYKKKISTFMKNRWLAVRFELRTKKVQAQ